MDAQNNSEVQRLRKRIKYLLMELETRNLKLVELHGLIISLNKTVEELRIELSKAREIVKGLKETSSSS